MSKCTCINAISPSELDSYLNKKTGCQRKWGFRRLAELPEPPFKFQEDGVAIHKHLENYLVSSIMPPTDKQDGIVALKCLPLLPPPSVKHKCEEHLSFVIGDELDFITFHGYPDFRPDALVKIVDFKTTSDFKWAKTWDELKGDAQVLVYGYHTLLEYPFAAGVDYEWIYMRRSKTLHPTRRARTS